MAIDSSIYSQVQAPAAYNPLADFARVQQIQGLQNQNRLAGLAFQDRERSLADAAAQRDAVRGFGNDTTANYNKLLQLGNLNAAQEYQKQVGEQGKARAEATKIGVETGGKAFDVYKSQLATTQDPNQAAALVTAAYHDPVVGPLMQRYGTLEDGLGRLQQALSEPGGFDKWRAGAAIGIEKLAELAKTQNVNLGGTMQTQVVQPATGQVSVIGSAPITQSADNMASNATSRANNSASVGATYAGIRAQDVRAGQTLDETRLHNRATEAASGDKPLTDSQAKALGFGARMQASNNILNQLQADGKTYSTPGTRAGYGIGTVVNGFNSTQGQQLDQAKRDFVNAILRRESGAAISPSEFASAEQQYFPQPGEGAAVIEQKRQARERSMRGVLAEVPDSKRGKVAEVIGPNAAGAAPAADGWSVKRVP